MCLQTPMYCWPLAWLSFWRVGAAMNLALMSSVVAPRWPSLRLRTPLLTLHVSTLKLRPHGDRPTPYEMHRPTLTLVRHDCGDS